MNEINLNSMTNTNFLHRNCTHNSQCIDNTSCCNRGKCAWSKVCLNGLKIDDETCGANYECLS